MLKRRYYRPSQRTKSLIRKLDLAVVCQSFKVVYHCTVGRDLFMLPGEYAEIIIIEWVDSICRDSADTQYMIIQKISPNLTNSKLISVDDNVSSIFEGVHDQQDH